MTKYRILVLTDHQTHSSENSIYALLTELLQRPAVAGIDLASRSNPANDRFFAGCDDPVLSVWRVKAGTALEPIREALMSNQRRVDARDYDVVWLRLPRPVTDRFFDGLSALAGAERIINRPAGIQIAGSKAWLLHWPDLCPPMRLVQSIPEIIDFQRRFPIVLKPLENYGGKGILRVSNDLVDDGEQQLPLEDFQPQIAEELARGGYLAMKFLPAVDQGDKRIVVVNGQVIGAALRLPPPDSWLCNVARGGGAIAAWPDAHEQHIIRRLNQELISLGIVMYGIDTLMGEQGRRLLSEVNVLSIGGIKQMAELAGEPLVERTVDQLLQYIQTHIEPRASLRL